MEAVIEAVLGQLFDIALKVTVLIAAAMVLACVWRSPSARSLLDTNSDVAEPALEGAEYQGRLKAAGAPASVARKETPWAA